MSGSRPPRVAGLLLAALLSAAAAGAQEKCGTCHPKERVAFEQSVHAAEELSCAACHRGRAETLDVDAAHGGDFRALTDRRREPGLCAECHSDLARMRPYNLPIDQLAVYRTSHHGEAVARGDTRAAVCSDCHGAHEVRRPGDPASPAHPRNLPATCGGCHGDPELMGRYGLDADLVAAYRESVHGRALLEAGNLAAPECTDCHGAHGPTPPGFGDVDKVCGSCHVETRRAFLAGPHYRGMLEAELPECASCHRNHAIRRFDLSQLEGLCLECHQEDSAEALEGRKILALVEAAREEVEQAEQLTAEAARVPIDVEDHLGRIEEAKTHLTETDPLVHAVSVEAVEVATRRARSIGEEVRHELYEKLDRRTARLGLALFWFYVLMTLAVLWAYKQRLRRRGPAA